jgi:Domain of unknown function (DUF4397)
LTPAGSTIARHHITTTFSESFMRTTYSAAAIVTAALIAACGSKDDTRAVETSTGDQPAGAVSPSAAAADARGTSMVRFVNAMPGSAALTVSSDSMALFSDVKPGDVTSYRELEENVKTFSLGKPGATSGTPSNTESMRDGGRYTIFALSNREGGTDMKIVRDDLAPEAGKARIRLVHAAPGMDDVDVMMTGQDDPVFNDVDYGTEAGFKDVTPGNVALTVRHEDKNLAVASLRSLPLKAGAATTLILISRGAGKVDVVKFTDEMVGTGTAADTARR